MFGIKIGGLEKPGDKVKQAEEQLELGILAGVPDAGLIKQFSLPKEQGVRIDRVNKNSVAEKAGFLKEGLRCGFRAVKEGKA